SDAAPPSFALAQLHERFEPRAYVGCQLCRHTRPAQQVAELLGELKLAAAMTAHAEMFVELAFVEASEVPIQVLPELCDGILASDHGGSSDDEMRCCLRAYSQSPRSSCLRPRNSRASTVPTHVWVISPISRAV